MRISDWSSDVCSSDLILVGGGLAKDIAVRHGISPKRSASLLDIFACVVQGVLPYGAQILLAGSLAAVSPLALAGKVYYCWILAAVEVGRSEEHTSELQSLMRISSDVFCLKITKRQNIHTCAQEKQ